MRREGVEGVRSEEGGGGGWAGNLEGNLATLEV